MLRYSSALLLLAASGATAASEFLEAFNAYGDRIEECHQIAKDNKQKFPVNGWFDALPKQEKKNVILFISFDNDESCSGAERLKLRALADDAPMGQKGFVLKVTEKPDYFEYIDSLDIKEVRELQSKYQQPFDSLRVGDDLKLFIGP